MISCNTTDNDNNDDDNNDNDDGNVLDLVVIGGGVVGLAICRHAALLELGAIRVACVEKEAHLLQWASGSNSGIACTGVDAAVGTLERALIRDSLAQLRTFARDMNLPLRPCGSLVCQWPWDSDDTDDEEENNNNSNSPLQHVLMESHDAGDTHATLLTPAQVLQEEPHLNPSCRGAVHIPGEVVVDPWVHSIAYAVHARQNGAKIYTNFEVDMRQSTFDDQHKIWTLRRRRHPSPTTAPESEEATCRTNTTPNELRTRAVVNAAGLWADLVQRDMLAGCSSDTDDANKTQQSPQAEPQWEARPRRGQYRVFQCNDDANASTKNDPPFLTHPIQPIPTDRTKGIFVFSTLYNQIVVGPTATDQESRTDRSIDPDTVDLLTGTVQHILPRTTKCCTVVGDYVGIRPGTNHRDYQFHLTPDKHWLACAGIRSTGLTASTGIGRHVIQTLQSAGILVSKAQPLPPPPRQIQTIPLPPVSELARAYRASGSRESVTIDGYEYKVTHPLTRFGFAAGTGIAAAPSSMAD